ncbi:16792_t:CDS:1, partial [Racocetra fulgida]
MSNPNPDNSERRKNASLQPTTTTPAFSAMATASSNITSLGRQRPEVYIEPHIKTYID